MRRYKANSIIQITFDDHCQGHDKPIRCVVFGRVHSCDKHAITVKSWDYHSPVPALDHNIETFTIMQSAITHVKRLG